MTIKALIHLHELEQMILAELRGHYAEITQVTVKHRGRAGGDSNWEISYIAPRAHVSGKRAAIAIQQRLAREYDLLMTA